MLATLSGFLALVALLLAFVGVYGLISFSVTQRRREFGIRLALGATPARLRRMVVGEGLLLGVSGVGIGVVIAIAVSRAIASLLYGVAPSDAWVLVGAGLFFIGISVSAGVRPASRAASVDPAETLRSE